MSTIFADKFKNTSGGNPVQINQLRGIDTAGSITIQGENTNTTNLQQGLCKVWVQLDAENTATLQTIEDSFNVTSQVDPGTGKTTVNFTNNMANISYSWSTGICNGGGFNDTATINVSNDELPTTSTFRFYSYMNGAMNDARLACVNIHGDLA